MIAGQFFRENLVHYAPWKVRLVEVANRINRQAVDPDLIMHMRPGARPGIPGIRDYIAAFHVLSRFDV